MRIEHVAIWTKQLEALKDFYVTYFAGRAGEKYVNPQKQFESFFIIFESGARLELMRKANLPEASGEHTPAAGYAHMAFSVGSEDAVNGLTRRLQDDGYSVMDGPRRTGDGYYESVVLDPDGNRVEITI